MATRSAKKTLPDPLIPLRKICLALPDASEAINHGRPCFVVSKKTFVMFMRNHHDDGRVAIWCKAPPGVQGMLVDANPDRFFVPPYVGPSGWIGVRLEGKVDWSIVSDLVTDAFRMTAGKRILAKMKPNAG